MTTYISKDKALELAQQMHDKVRVLEASGLADVSEPAIMRLWQVVDQTGQVEAIQAYRKDGMAGKDALEQATKDATTYLWVPEGRPPTVPDGHDVNQTNIRRGGIRIRVEEPLGDEQPLDMDTFVSLSRIAAQTPKLGDKTLYALTEEVR